MGHPCICFANKTLDGPKDILDGMKREILLKILTGSLLLGCLTLAAQEKGAWQAASNTAQSITGDISFSPDKLSINYVHFPIARIRDLEKSEIAATFDADSSPDGTGSLYRLNVPATQKFLRKNSLCGGDDTHWMLTFASGRTLQVAFFSSQKVPTLTREAISNSTDLCGTFTYVK
jgi:hypothetical protein